MNWHASDARNKACSQRTAHRERKAAAWDLDAPGAEETFEQKGNIRDEMKSETRTSQQKRNQPSDEREWWWQ
jgi:hypothetical protein